MTNSKLSTRGMLAMSAPAVPMFALMMPLVIFIPPFYAEQMGLGLAVVGGIFTLGRLFDVVTDPVAGIVMDKTQDRFTKRFWVTVGAIPLAIATSQIFFASPPGDTVTLMFWIVVLYAGWTLMSVGLYSWAGEITDDYHERSRVMGAIQMANSAGTVGVLMVPAVIELVGIEGDVALLRVQAMGVFILAMLPVTLLIAWFLAPASTRRSEGNPALLPALREAMGSRALRLLLAADLAVGLNIGIFTSLTVFLTEIVLGLGGAAGTLQLALLGSAFLGVPVFVAVASRIEKHRTMALTSGFTALGGVCIFFIPAESFALVFASYLLFGFASGAAQMFPRAIMSDIVDESRAVSGDQNTGLYFSFLTTTLKLGLALGVGVSFGLAELGGFDPAVARTDASAHWVIRAIMGVGGILLGVAIALLMWRFPLDRARQEKLKQRIAESR